MAKKEQNAAEILAESNASTTQTLGQGSLEVQVDQSIEPIVNLEMEPAKAFDMEAFMNEIVIINVAETTDENQPPHVVVSVNGVNQPIARGVDTPVKRKYVEVLARCKETKFSQPARNMDNPEAGNGLRGKTALAYPFTIIQDRNQRGGAWLSAVLKEAN